MIATQWAISSLLALWSLKIGIGIPRIIGLASHWSKGELKPRNGPDRGEGQAESAFEYLWVFGQAFKWEILDQPFKNPFGVVLARHNSGSFWLLKIAHINQWKK